MHLARKCRVIIGGIDREYLGRALNDFERFVVAVVGMGVTAIYWSSMAAASLSHSPSPLLV